MIKRVLPLALTLILVLTLLPATVLAGGEGINIFITYYDADNSEITLETLFENKAMYGTFVLRESGGQTFSFTSTDYDGYGWLEARVNEMCYWKGLFSAGSFGLLPGKYTFESGPLPDGYEIVEVRSGPFSISQEDYDNNTFSSYHIDVMVRKTGTDAPADVHNTDAIPDTDALPTSSAVLVNNENVAFDAYNIGGNNFFKLRDLAYALNGSEKQFEVRWDAEKNAIGLTSGEAYTLVGGEMASKGSEVKTPIATTSSIYLDGNEIALTAYNIDGNNYFKLRDIGEVFDFGVEWDGANNTIIIDTAKGYSPD